MTFLISIIVFHFVGLILLDKLPYDNISILYIGMTKFELLLVSVYAYLSTSIKQTKLKCLSLAIVFLFSWELMNYTLYSIYKNDAFTTLLDVSVFVLFIPLIANIIFRSYYNNSDIYIRNKCYLVYRKPKNLQGFLISLFRAPYGQCSLLINGKRFCFKQGILVEVAHSHKLTYIYRGIPDVELSEARLMLGQEWTVFNNCFAVFNKFKGSNSARQNKKRVVRFNQRG